MQGTSVPERPPSLGRPASAPHAVSGRLERAAQVVIVQGNRPVTKLTVELIARFARSTVDGL